MRRIRASQHLEFAVELRYPFIINSAFVSNHISEKGQLLTCHVRSQILSLASPENP
jgi:hypothetical protein